MKLKRLIIQGFKSFKDRTTIHFDDGITGIVGPNGCGKSNIVDALFWVMGEMSAKHLRGNSMKDVIFSGSERYKPGTWAEATLVLDNSEGKHIHIGNKVASPSEIELTRKLYRNGESEYRINKNPCRLKDVQEVFMDTGAGAKSYSIIAQGEINRLVQAKPQERRVMIEEVAGITKFKLRRRDSLKKIEATESNLERLKDLKSEIEKNLRSLQKQAEKAERARSLKEKIKRHELIVNSHKIFDLLKNNKEKRHSFSENLTLVETWGAKKQVLENDLSNERVIKDELTEKLEEFQGQINKSSGELAGLEERLKHLVRGKEDKEKLKSRSEKELEDIQKDIEERSAKLTEVKESLEKLTSMELDTEDLENEKETLELLKDTLGTLEDDSRDLVKKEEDLKASLHEKENDLFKNNAKIEEYARVLEDIALERENLEGQYSSVSKELSSERDEISSLEREYTDLEESLQLSQVNLEESKEKLNSVEENKKAIDREFIGKESRLDSLKELQKSLEGVTKGAKEFLQSDKGQNFELFGNILECEDKYSAAVQSILSNLLQTIVSSTGERISSLDDFSATLLRFNADAREVHEESIERVKLALEIEEGEIRSLNEVVKFNAKIKGLKETLSSFYIVDNSKKELFSALAPDMNFDAIVSEDGTVVVKNYRNFQITEIYSENDKTVGLVERNNQISELTVECEELGGKLEKINEEYESATEAYQLARTELDRIQSEFLDKKTDYNTKKSLLESKLSSFDHGNQRLELLKNRQSEVSKNRLDYLEGQDQLEKAIETLKEQKEAVSNELYDLNVSLQDKKEEYQDRRSSYVEKELEAKNFVERTKSFTDQIEDIENTIAKYESKVEENTELIASYEKEIQETVEEVSQLEVSTKEMASALKERETELRDQKDELAELLTQMQDREDEVKDLTQRISRSEKENMEIEVNLSKYISEEEQITRNIFEKYQVDLRKALGNFLEYDEALFETLNDISSMFIMETQEGEKEIKPEAYEFIRRYGQDLKDSDVKYRQYKTEYNRLGEINWQAVEDYDRQKLRFDFLKNQEVELNTSLEDLRNAITHIDQKSRKRFKDAFEEVNVRFRKVFPIIFGGGTAELRITGNIDEPDCGVDIIAQPPGKKMQNINLMSGGEKALTAVSLIFSIFLVKPSPFCLLDEVDAPLDDANVGRFNELLREMSSESQFILITHNKKTMELNDTLYGVTMQEPGISSAVSVQLQ